METDLASANKEGRIGSIDGLKGGAALWVMFFHYLLAFAPAGFIGWHSPVWQAGAAEQCRYYVAHFPYSLFTNSSFALYVFFALIAYIPAVRFLKQGDNLFIYKQAVTRYIRFMPSTLAASVLAYLGFLCFGGITNELVVETGNTWLEALNTQDVSLTEALRVGAYGSLLEGEAGYNTVLWCMSLILGASYLVYAVLLMFGRLHRREALFAILFLLSLLVPGYAAFVSGILAAAFSLKAVPGRSSEKKAVVLMVAGIGMGSIPQAVLPAWAPAGVMFGPGTLLFLLGFVRSHLMDRLFSGRWVQQLGRISFGVILVHAPVMLTFSAWLYMKLASAGVAQPVNALLTYGAALPVVWALSVLFYRLVERPSSWLCGRVFAWFVPVK